MAVVSIIYVNTNTSIASLWPYLVWYYHRALKFKCIKLQDAIIPYSYRNNNEANTTY